MMIETLMALWNRGLRSRCALGLIVLLLICISISLFSAEFSALTAQGAVSTSSTEQHIMDAHSATPAANSSAVVEISPTSKVAEGVVMCLQLPTVSRNFPPSPIPTATATRSWSAPPPTLRVPPLTASATPSPTRSPRPTATATPEITPTATAPATPTMGVTPTPSPTAFPTVGMTPPATTRATATAQPGRTPIATTRAKAMARQRRWSLLELREERLRPIERYSGMGHPLSVDCLKASLVGELGGATRLSIQQLGWGVLDGILPAFWLLALLAFGRARRLRR